MTTERLSMMDRYRRDIADTKRLSSEEEAELARRYEEGDQRAGDRLIVACLPFVITIARKYRRWGIPLEDLVQQGNLGLLKAAKRYEPDRECRLLTYAGYWIRAEIRDYVVRGYRIVRLGTTRTERNAIRTYRSSGVGSVEELAERSGMPLKRAKMLWPLLTRRDMSTDQQYQERDSLGERLSAPGLDPESEFAKAQLSRRVREKMSRLVNGLDTREQTILRERIMAEEPKTLRDLGNKFGVSKERVRQLELRTRGKLREGLQEFAPLVCA